MKSVDHGRQTSTLIKVPAGRGRVRQAASAVGRRTGRSLTSTLAEHPERRLQSRPPGGIGSAASSMVFTLIELLVVLAILGILLALLLPVLSRARFNARVVTCMSHQRQWHLALTMFADDHDGAFPAHRIPEFVGNNPWNIGVDFYDKMPDDYNLKHELMSCPLQPLTAARMATYRNSHGAILLGYSYWVPHFAASGAQVDPAVAAPAGFADLAAQERPLLTDFAACQSNPPWYWMTNHRLADELININHLYLDGSVKLVPADQVQERQHLHYRVFY